MSKPSAKNSVLASYNPLVILLYYLCAVGCTVLLQSPVVGVLSLLGAALTMMSIRRFRIKTLLIYLLMIVVITLTNPLFSHRGATPLLFVNDLPITLEALLFGAYLGCMIAAVLCWSACLSALLDSGKTRYILSKFSRRLALLFSMIMRFIPQLRRRAAQLVAAQRGVGGFEKPSVGGVLKLCSALVSQGLEMSVDTAYSMKARGYGRRERSCCYTVRFEPRDAVAAALLVLLTVSVFVYSGDYSYYPTALPPTFGMGELGFAALIITPATAELKERIVWKCCELRI